MNEKEKKIFEERGSLYGEGTEAHTNLGLIWTGLIQNHYRIKLPYPLPPDLVLLMFVGSKANRAACHTTLLDDNYDDGKIYMEMARKAKHDRTRGGGS